MSGVKINGWGQAVKRICRRLIAGLSITFQGFGDTQIVDWLKADGAGLSVQFDSIANLVGCRYGYWSLTLRICALVVTRMCDCSRLKILLLRQSVAGWLKVDR